MAKAYSDDLRRKVLERYALGEETLADLAERFDVSVAWTKKISAAYTRTGRMERPQPARRGRKRKVTPEIEAWVRAAVQAQADMTLAELQVGLYQQQQLEISIGALWNTLRRLNLRLKKTLHAAEQDSETVQRQRAQWQVRMAQEPAANLIFLDESGITTEMTRRYGRGLGGQRVPEGTPGRWRTLTVLGAISLTGWVATMTIESPTDGDVFRAYVEQVLCPKLSAGQIVVMDNLSAHKVDGIRERIQATGARLCYLPPYSPDYNPIERCWAQVKQALRATKARTVADLEVALPAALDTVLTSHISAYFRSCGYAA